MLRWFRFFSLGWLFRLFSFLFFLRPETSAQIKTEKKGKATKKKKTREIGETSKEDISNKYILLLFFVLSTFSLIFVTAKLSSFSSIKSVRIFIFEMSIDLFEKKDNWLIRRERKWILLRWHFLVILWKEEEENVRHIFISREFWQITEQDHFFFFF